MKRALAAATSLIFLIALASAQDAIKPAFPLVKVGFDDGRVDLIREVEVSNLDPERLVQRVFEDWHRADVAAFLARHTTLDERKQLDKALKQADVLAAADAVDAIQKSKLTTAQVADALGKLLGQRGYSGVNCCAWLYARDINCAAQLKYAGSEAFHPFRVQRELRELADKGEPASKIFARGLWEFDGRDGLLSHGGHYDGVQLVEGLIALGWGVEDFARALKKDAKALSPELKRLIAWGDARLIVPLLDGKISEAELATFAQAELKAAPADKALGVALLAAQSLTRWFRTSGVGVSAVYSGPMPAADRMAPTTSALEMPDDAMLFSAGLDDAMIKHFAPGGDWLTLVLYEDGGARAVLRSAKEFYEYGPDSPVGMGKHSVLLYEGRAGATAKAGAFTQVFAPKGASSPRIDLANLVLPAGGALLSASIEEGAALRPILLRRCSRLVMTE
ncbi:MAG: hypothetical protein IT462_05040 [Planctomycetes bacterium]|nr:hypothetical protein [Planctomycetota bacterium]